MTAKRIAEIKASCHTQQDILVAYLWYRRDWIPTHQLQSVETPFGFIGSAGAVRARELARGECPEKLKGKIERARGGEINKDARYEYFRYVTHEKELTDLQVAARAVRIFEASP